MAFRHVFMSYMSFVLMPECLYVQLTHFTHIFYTKKHFLYIKRFELNYFCFKCKKLSAQSENLIHNNLRDQSAFNDPGAFFRGSGQCKVASLLGFENN